MWSDSNGLNVTNWTVQQCWDDRACTESTASSATASTSTPMGKSLTVRVRANPANAATHLPSGWGEDTEQRTYPEPVTGFAINTLSIDPSVLPNPAVDPIVLSTEGTLDWVHWGLTAVGDVNRKSDATVQIGALQSIGGTLERWISGATRPAVSWTGGTPTATATETHAHIAKSAMPPGTGYRFTFPASASQRVAVLYLTGYWSTSTITASLGGAVASENLGSVSLGNIYEVRITYSGTGALTVDYLKTSDTSTASPGVIGAALTEPE
jgi:hypothetical protein